MASVNCRTALRWARRGFVLSALPKELFYFVAIAVAALSLSAPAIASSPLATTTAFAVSTNSIGVGSAVVLTATVKDQNTASVSTGEVKFCLAGAAHCQGAALLGTAQLTAAGTGTLTLRFGAGTYSIKAIFSGTNAYAASASGAQNVTVSGKVPSTTTLAASGVPGNYSLSAKIMAGGVTPPTGGVTFLDAGSTLASATMDSASATSTFVESAYTTGASPNFSAVADLNGDGVLDLVVTNEQDNTAGVLLGNADGSFQSQRVYATGRSPAGLVIGDFNGDGKLDLAVVNQDGTVSILLGNGAGSFAAQHTYPAANGPGLAAGDLNGDGKLDLAMVDWGSNVVRILLGNGDGSFRSPSSFATGRSPHSVAIGDFNRDGALDLAVVNESDFTVSILLGNGDGSFRAQTTYATAGSPASVIAADFNGDGALDLAIANISCNRISVLLGNGDGTFQPEPTYDTDACPFAIASGDFDGDGKLDLLTANHCAHSVSLLRGNGDGTFLDQQKLQTGDSPWSLGVGDFDADGRADFVVTTLGDSSANVFLNQWSVQAAVSNVFVLGGGTTHSVMATYAGDSEHLSSNSNSISLVRGVETNLQLTVAPGSRVQPGQSVQLTAALVPNRYNGTAAAGTVTFHADGVTIGTPQSLDATGQASINVGVLTGGSHTLSASYSGDNIFPPEDTSVSVLVLNTSTTLSVSANQVSAGTSTLFSVAVTDQDNVPVTGGQVKFCDAAATSCQDSALLGTAQLTPSGTATLKLRLSPGTHSVKAIFVGTNANAVSTSNTQSVVVNAGNLSTTTLTATGTPGDYTLTATVTASGYATPSGVVTFTDSSDSGAQVPTATLDRASAIWTFQTQRTYSTGTAPGALAVADFNGDGIPDFAVANQQDNTASVFLGNGDGTFQSRRNFTTGSGPSGVAVADLNGDGKLDLAVSNRSDNTVSILLGNGDGTFQGQVSYQAGGESRGVTVADFNGDGIPDVAVPNSNNSTISVLLGMGDGSFQAQRVFATGAFPSLATAADLNGDGKPDLVVGITGGISVLLGNGDGTFQTHREYAAGSNLTGGWSVVVSDFNRDGKPDLAVTKPSGDGLCVLLGNGDGTFQDYQLFWADIFPYGLASGDFNGDGKLDLVTADSGYKSVSVLLGNGDGTLQHQIWYATGSYPLAVAAGDFNADGQLDLAVANSGDNTVSVLLGQWAVQATVAHVAVVGTGTQDVVARYAGSDVVLASASAAVPLTATVSVPVITWAVPAAIPYGTALSSVHLNATANVPGTFVYTPAARTVLSTGTHTLSLTFTPTDAHNYAAVTRTVSLAVNKATPTIHWATPAAITSGTALGDAQLNATADIPGTFVYTPSKGTVPEVGTQTLSVRFRPADTSNYTEVTATVSLKVNEPENLVPVITSLSPALVKAGSSGFNLVVSGTGFGAGATVTWNGSARTTTAVSGGLQAEISAADIASSGTANITVANPAGLGGAVSSRYQFVIDTAAAASGGFTVTVPTTATVEPGKDTQVPVTLAGVSSGAAVTVTCLNVPEGVTCSYQKGVLIFTTSSNTPRGTYPITTVFSTTTQAAAMRHSSQGYLAVWLGLAGLPFGLIWAGGIRKTVGRCGIALAGLVLILALAGCGGGAIPNNPPGSPTTPTSPVSRQSSAVVTLTVR